MQIFGEVKRVQLREVSEAWPRGLRLKLNFNVAPTHWHPFSKFLLRRFFTHLSRHQNLSLSSPKLNYFHWRLRGPGAWCLPLHILVLFRIFVPNIPEHLPLRPLPHRYICYQNVEVFRTTISIKNLLFKNVSIFRGTRSQTFFLLHFLFLTKKIKT